MSDRPTLSEVQESQAEGGRPTYQLILILASILFLFLPFVTTFNHFLTQVVMRLHLDVILEGWVVPMESRMIAVLLSFLGIEAGISEPFIYLTGRSGARPLYINWNCVGWQSFILFAVTLITGMQGPYTKASKLRTVILGFLGTFWMNLLRITAVCVVAFYFGQLAAIIFHDYGGTAIILVWLAFFWYFSTAFILEGEWVEEAEDTVEKLTPNGIGARGFSKEEE